MPLRRLATVVPGVAAEPRVLATRLDDRNALADREPGHERVLREDLRFDGPAASGPRRPWPGSPSYVLKCRIEPRWYCSSQITGTWARLAASWKAAKPLGARVEAREVAEVGDDQVELGEPLGVAPADLLGHVAPLGQVRLQLVDAARGLLAVVDHAHVRRRAQADVLRVVCAGGDDDPSTSVRTWSAAVISSV